MKLRTVTLTLVVSCLLAGQAAAGGFHCWDVAGNGPSMTKPDPATGYFRGDIPVKIGGRAFTIDSQSLNFGDLVVGAVAGGVTSRLSHLWQLRENNQKIVTFDTIVLTPTDDPAVLDAHIHFVVETGNRFNCGEIIGTGKVDVSIPAYIGATFGGRFCDCRSGGDD